MAVGIGAKTKGPSNGGSSGAGRRRGRGLFPSDEAVRLVEAERQRLSLEIHDGAAQWMVSAAYRLQAFEQELARNGTHQASSELSEITDLINQSLRELRRVIAGLHPFDLTEMGLVEALHRTLDNLEKDSGIACALEVKGHPHRLPPPIEITAFRVAQEALANVRKHSQAAKAKLTLNFARAELRLVVRDDGIGVDPALETGKPRADGGVGIRGMKERARALGGSVEIEGVVGEGSTITLILPLAEVYGPSAAAETIAA